MTATLDRPAHHAAQRTGNLTGTWQLVRLALRRDRVILPLWILLLSFTPAGSAGAYDQLYPNPAEREMLSATLGANPSVAVVYGPAFDLSTAGGFTAWRMGSFLAVFIGLMAVFTVTRHTRAEEDTGRLELLSAGVLGRYAALTAAIVVSGGTSLIVGFAQAGSLVGTGLPAAGSWAFGLSTAAAGLVFTAVAAVAVQVAEYSRTANGIGATVLGAAFLLRAVGDSTTDVTWLSWLSPVGWAQQIRPYAGERWWVLALPVVLTLVLAAVAYSLLPRRDLGTGILPPRPGPSAAASSLSSPLALAWRLHRGALIGWTVGMAVVGATFGSIANGIGGIVGASEQTRQMFEKLGGSSGIIDAFLATMTGMFGMVTAIYGVQAVLRMRSEETAVRAEPLLATRVSRLRWTLSHLTFALLGPVFVTAVAGFAMGAGHGLRVGDLWGTVADVFGGTLVQLPAIWVVIGVAMVLFGVLPKYTILAWAVAIGCVLLTLFGPILGLSEAFLNISPFSHIPKVPGGDVTAPPLLWLSAIAAVALVAGLAAFRRRDVG
ncbi:ABC transporter permease [Amycolatopsis suaedae]|uniref:ABC transporter permease n=1 Tax=Amycolatopsis suaedae TaxID=2510978 RepID=A0A4V2EMK3_9PSEU|nr:ABC transporter permease [Amycolatopsis suaedae]RZQ65365.1 ABC transporter permease [Amycolatopsis suaedae]